MVHFKKMILTVLSFLAAKFLLTFLILVRYLWSSLVGTNDDEYPDGRNLFTVDSTVGKTKIKKQSPGMHLL